MASKPFWKSKKWWAMAAGGAVLVIPLVRGMVPADSRIYGLLGIALVIAVYIHSQGKVDVARTNKEPPQ